MKMMDMTASQAQVLTAPYAGESTAQQVLDIPVSFGAGADAASFTDILRETKCRLSHQSLKVAYNAVRECEGFTFFNDIFRS